MIRRKALVLTASVVGGTIVGANVFLSGCTPSENPIDLFSKQEIRLMDEIGEIILPHSEKSPGAKATQIGEFMKKIVTDCYIKVESDIFRNGLKIIENKSLEIYSKNFMLLSSEQGHEILLGFDEEARNIKDQNPKHFFTMMKQLTIWGYFTSEPGATRALRYNPLPGRYECIDYESGDKAWV